MTRKLIVLLLLAWTAVAVPAQVTIDNSEAGAVLKVDGHPLVINGMNWDYFPIGSNYAYSLWQQPDDMIREALDREMTLLRDMGVNVIRQYADIPPRWVRYIYEHYGIYTMLNHTFGRYGLEVNHRWMANTDYSHPKVRRQLLRQVRRLAKAYKDNPGVLLFLLGNENNYGLFWQGAETEDFPMEDRASTRQAHALYSLFNEAVLEMKRAGADRPVGICNGDDLFLDLIGKECPDIDYLALNSYRGPSFTGAFTQVKTLTGKPLLFSEFGSDCYNVLTQSEDQQAQADILQTNWEEIYGNTIGHGEGNCLGGFTFQFSDGWWKHGQTENLTVHDTVATWHNGGYAFDYVEGQNNMNEEWFGICAKGQPDSRGLYTLSPRTAYYVLQRLHTSRK